MNTTGKEIKNWPTDHQIDDGFRNSPEPTWDEYAYEVWIKAIQWLKSQLQEPAEGKTDYKLLMAFARYFWCYETGGDWQGTDKQMNMILDHFEADRDKPTPPEQPVKSAEEEWKAKFDKWCEDYHKLHGMLKISLSESFSREDMEGFAEWWSENVATDREDGKTTHGIFVGISNFQQRTIPELLTEYLNSYKNRK